MGFIDYLTEDFVSSKLLFEGKLDDEPPKKISRIIATLSGKDEFLFTLYSEHMLWEEKPGIGTAGVRPYGDGQHFVFVYDPAWFLGLPKSQVYFLLGHEIYHILRDHHKRSTEKFKGSTEDHNLSNICMDVWINTDLHGEKTLGGFTMEPPFEVFGYRCPGDWGDVENWVKETVKKVKDIDIDEKYEGSQMWEPLYDWVKEMWEKYDIHTDDDDDDGEPKEQYPSLGDIISFNGQYGEVVSLDSKTKQVTEIEPLTKDEAYKRVKDRG